VILERTEPTGRGALRPRWRSPGSLVLPCAVALLILAGWQLAVSWSGSDIFPSPWQVGMGIEELVRKGLLFKYIVASLFRVTWGFALAVLLGVPLGLLLGWLRPAFQALNPLIQVLRPISPIAWIPLAILWFGVGDLAAIYLIFVGCFFPLLLTAISAVHNVPSVYLDVGRNFGLSTREFILRVLYPAVVPQLIAGSRITFGIAWLVVVAAEMISVNSGLGFLIVDARNAGNRYDLVVAGMVVIGIIGLLLDLGMRSLEQIRSFRWGYSED
jgi:NitT/TauT family transport system permease protein